MSLENEFFRFSSKTHFKHGIPIWALLWENLLSPVVKQTQTHRSCFYLNNRLNGVGLDSKKRFLAKRCEKMRKEGKRGEKMGKEAIRYGKSAYDIIKFNLFHWYTDLAMVCY